MRRNRLWHRYFSAMGICAIILVVQSAAMAQTSWARTYAGVGTAGGESFVQPTSDGGYIVASRSTTLEGKTAVWVLKIDGYGMLIWQKTYGSSAWSWATAIQQTADGGYIVLGGIESSNGRNDHACILRLDFLGNITWQKSYAGTGDDYLHSVQQTIDGGYILAGQTTSFGSQYVDAWVLKIDSLGNVIWQKIYGAAEEERAYSIQQTTDGGYIVAGQTSSFGAGYVDVWIIKLTASGDVEWQKAYGGANEEQAFAIKQSANGGYIVAGVTTSYGLGYADSWLFKISNVGDCEWQYTYGTANNIERAYSLSYASNDGYTVASVKESVSEGSEHSVIYKINSTGNVVWQKEYGAAGSDVVYSIQGGLGGGYICSGYTTSYGSLSGDLWILKTDDAGDIDNTCPFISESAFTPIETQAMVINTSALVTSSMPIVANTTVSGVDSSAIITLLCAGPVVPGDCDGDGHVSIGEVQKAINMFLGTLAPSCGVDCNNDSLVTIGDVQKVINGFLGLTASC